MKIVPKEKNDLNHYEAKSVSNSDMLFELIKKVFYKKAIYLHL